MIRKLLMPVLLLLAEAVAGSQTIIPLPTGENGPNVEFEANDAYFNVSVPTLSVVPAVGVEGNAPAMLICPGGGYLSVGKDNEGFNVARYLSERGITCFVLKYRTRHLGTTKEESLSRQRELFFEIFGEGFTPEGQLSADHAYEDALAAMELIRSRASELHVNPERIGIVGFSAGALVAIRVGQHHSEASAPNIVAPIYLWRNKDDSVPDDAAPLFLCAPQKDFCPTDMSYKLYKAWSERGLPAEIHVLSLAHHGHGYQNGSSPSDIWMDLFYSFLRNNKFTDRYDLLS